MKKVECFKIQIWASGDGGSGYQPVHRLLCDNRAIFKEPTIILADPFLFVCDDTLYLFYEHKKLFHNGTIMMTCTKNLRDWFDPVEVLSEPFHLSYPWVFENDGHIYMIPETCENRSVRLYEAVNPGLTKFKFVKDLLVQEPDASVQMSYSDSSIIKKNGRYYLYTTVMRNGTNHLLLYCADNLQGPYGEHFKSPVCISQKYGRNGGSLIEYSGGLYRIAQDCTVRYGDNVHVLKVTELSETDYKEEVIQENVLDTTVPFYREGGHQLSYVEFRGKMIIATDAKEYNSFAGLKLIRKFKSLLKRNLYIFNEYP